MITLLPQRPHSSARSALPRALRIAEVDIDVGLLSEPLVIGRLPSSVPGQRSVQFAGQLPGVRDQRRDDGGGVLACDLHQHHVTRVALHQRHGMAVLGRRQQIPFPVRGQVADLAQGYCRSAVRAYQAYMVLLGEFGGLAHSSREVIRGTS